MQTLCTPCLQETSGAPNGFRWDAKIIKLAIGLLFAGQSMVFSLAINVSPAEEPGVRVAVQGLILAATMIVVILLGGPLLRTATAELMHGRLTIEILFVTTIVGALLASLQSFLTGTGPIFFEVISVLLVVYTFGKLIGAHSRARALAATRAWSESLAVCRRVDARGRAESTLVSEIQPGDLVEISPGEFIPVDGVIVRGVGFISEAAVTGESFPSVRRAGDSVLAGAASHDATLLVEATVPGTARHIDELLDAVENASRIPTSLQGQADRLAARLVPLIIAISLATFGIWTCLAGWQTALFNAMAVLLVACPCALGLAVPIVTWTTIRRLAERGLTIKSGDIIERLANVDCVLFDKTGTLTEEQLTVADIATRATGAERTRLLGWLATVEAHCNHPAAKAFARLMPKEEATILGLRTVPGAGVVAEIRCGGEAGCVSVGRHMEEHRLRVGRPEWLESAHSKDESALLAELRFKNGQRIDVELDGRLAAIAILTERLRSSARDTMLELQGLGLPVTVLTGDTAERAAAIGLTAPVRASLLPEDKRLMVVNMVRHGERPLFVGDGVNDASALAQAHASVSLASGTDLANAAADATLHNGDLSVLPFALALCRQAVASIHWNLNRALLYNLVGITLAAFGLIHPVVAALLMLASSLLVARSSARLGTFAGCHESPSLAYLGWRPMFVACGHGLALVAQGFVVVSLLDLAGTPAHWVAAAFAIAGCSLGWLWYQWDRIPHWLDMTIGMVTFANLGMIFGWWADLGFGPAQTCSCCCSGSLSGVGMWAGMLLLGNLAMALGLRRPLDPESAASCRWAMFTGGNIGMILGMFATGRQMGPQEFGPAAHMIAMSLGMTVGMVVGHFLVFQFMQWRPRRNSFGRASWRTIRPRPEGNRYAADAHLSRLVV
jgi:heavy metal translocating P-type ATPase